MAGKVWKGLKHVVAEGCDRTSEELARISGWLSKLRSDCPELKLLVIGETGVGKSTLINNLLGDEVAGVGHKVESATSTIAHYIGEIEGVPVRLYDTPGLGDSRSERDDEIPAGNQKANENRDHSPYNLLLQDDRDQNAPKPYPDISAVHRDRS